MLRASARQLRLGLADEANATALESLAVALESPTGFSARMLGAINYEFFLPTAEGLHAALKAEGYARDEYDLVGLQAITPDDQR
ncbi:hypothetical protein LMG667_17445 [Xanthomonas euvesicatoria]|nr:hypothetical protein LMG667_17445 [Xanthomonas euvesicatoria]